MHVAHLKHDVLHSHQIFASFETDPVPQAKKLLLSGLKNLFYSVLKIVYSS